MLPEVGTAPELSVSEFVALVNQTFEFAYPSLTITGELANLRVSKNRWVYFDLKDEFSTVKCFGTVYMLPGPLEEGMLLRVAGQPRLHNLYGFSFNVSRIQPSGEGTIRRAAELLQAKLTAEGLFDDARKRVVPYPPASIGLITSKQSAAYADFVKILQARWRGIEIQLMDVQVQGEVAPAQIVAAIEHFNRLSQPPEVLVLIRGGGSPEDLAAYSTEQVTRAVAASRIITVAAIGHETDLSLAELAADKRASTPSNAAELLVPDRAYQLGQYQLMATALETAIMSRLQAARDELKVYENELGQTLHFKLQQAQDQLAAATRLLRALNPTGILERGFAIVRNKGTTIRSARQIAADALVEVQLAQGSFTAQVTKTEEA